MMYDFIFVCQYYTVTLILLNQKKSSLTRVEYDCFFNDMLVKHEPSRNQCSKRLGSHLDIHCLFKLVFPPVEIVSIYVMTYGTKIGRPWAI